MGYSLLSGKGGAAILEGIRERKATEQVASTTGWSPGNMVNL